MHYPINAVLSPLGHRTLARRLPMALGRPPRLAAYPSVYSRSAGSVPSPSTPARPAVRDPLTDLQVVFGVVVGEA